MLRLLRQPIPLRQLALLSGGVTAAVAVYCLVYTALAGRPETVPQAFGWSIVNVLPWLFALEGAKRAHSLPGAALALLGGLAASLLLGFALIGSAADGWFELWRRVPTLGAVALLAIALRWSNHRKSTPDAGELPLHPGQIDWVRAAGNYVELRSLGRTIVHRASLSSLESQLRNEGFIRIHRSMLVRRERIARIRPTDVILVDGTHLKVGKRYRAALAA